MKAVLLLVFLAVGAYGSLSCSGRCGYSDYSQPCQCHSSCRKQGTCCHDYHDICFSCKNRCGEAYLKSKPCQCNKGCASHSNCCSDYHELCAGSASDDALRKITEVLLRNDYNNACHLIKVDHQGHGTSGDLAPRPYFTDVRPEALKGPTIAALIALQDNYIPDVNKAEVVDFKENIELEHFLDVIMVTEVMQITKSFLKDWNIFTGNLRNKIKEMWFDLYTRGSSHAKGSSGFEHSFVGEIKHNKVFGLHNWVYFYTQERAGKINYQRWNRLVDLGDKGEIIENGFTWLNYPKPYGGMFTGTSPEFELAVYTLCFLARPDARCPVQMNGQRFYIKTFTWYTGGKKTGGERLSRHIKYRKID